MEIEESGWTKENLLKLLASLKASIPKHKKNVCYRKELETVDWNEVALPSFSSEECQEKWTSIMKKIPKIRTLTELINEAEDVILNPSHNSKIHPELPKRPAPPAATFFQENMAQLKNEHPELKSKELNKILFKRFSNLSNEEKAKYEKKHGLAVKEYKTELKKFCKEYGKPSTHCLRHRKRKMVSLDTDHSGDENDLPLKPITNGYMLFCKEQSKSIGEGQKGRMMHMWSKAWQKLDETEKMKYLNQGKELKRQYRIKLKNYLKRFDKDEQHKILKENGISRRAVCTIKNCKTVKTLPNEPKMPTITSHIVFVSEKIKLLKEIPLSRDRFIEVNKMWQTLPSKEKERYKAKVERKFRQYADELQKWFQSLAPEDQLLYLKRNPSKSQYLDFTENKMCNTKEVCQPSDSEDEDLMVSSSSSDEEGNILNFEEEEDDEEEEDKEENMFEMY